MAVPHIYYDPFMTISGTDFVADSKRVSLTPSNILADMDSWGTPGVSVASGLATWTFRAEMKITYANTTGTWNALNTLFAARVAVTVILKPSDAAVAVTNPSATFSIYPPAVTFIEAPGPGQTGNLTIEAQTYGAPVFATV